MSFKVYNGYEIIGVNTVSEALAFAKEFKTKLNKLRNKLRNKLILDLVANLAAEEFDLRTVGTSKATESRNPLSYISNQIFERTREIEKTGRRDPEVDFSCSLTFIPVQNKMLVLFYVERNEFTKLWEKFPRVKDYHYQNSSDKPKNIAQHEWNRRKANWDEALTEGTPAECGLSIDLSKIDILMPNAGEVVKNFPKFDQRVNNLSENLLRDKMFPTFLKGKDVNNGFAGISQALSEYEDWLKTKAGQTELKKVKQEVSQKLVKNPTQEDLLAAKT